MHLTSARLSFAALILCACTPSDLVSAVDTASQRPQTYFGASIGISSLQKALGASAGKPKKLAEGVWQLGDEDSPCGVLASSGKTPARLVCGDRPRDITTLG